MSDAFARLDGVSHRYGRMQALDGVSLALPAGRLIGLIGPDGVGKSTLLGLLTGVKRLQSGSVEVLGADLARAAERRRVCPRIAYMPQGLGRNLYAELSVFENLDFFGRLFRLGRAKRATRIAHLIGAVGLAPFAERPAGKLSGGMKQKLGLCCALIHDPDFLVLDEPTTGVDPLSRRQFWDLLAGIRADAPGMNVLVSTAYIEEAEGFDWLVAMNGGRIVATGTPDEFTARTGCASLEEAYRALRSKSGIRPEITLAPRKPDGDGPVIVARDLTRRFGDFIAVDGVSFEIERGEIFGFLGSNGCGKTTTMKMLTGLLPASSGDAALFGRPVNPDDRESRRDIGYMSQAFSLFGELTVLQNLDLHARLFALSEADRTRRIDDLTNRFGLAGHLDALASMLPLGLRQRLSLAVAVIHQPRVLILDEPTSGVDPDARDVFWELLTDLSRRDGVTIFLSTHFMTEAMRCDRVSLMHAGRVLACDRPEALVAAAGTETLEDAFIQHLRAAMPDATSAAPHRRPERAQVGMARPAGDAVLSGARLLAYAHRETVEVLRDPIRLAFAFSGTAILMVVFCLGISLDIEDLDFAVLDLAQDPESRAYVAAFEGSRYFNPTDPLADTAEGRDRLVDGRAALTIELPPDFGRKLRTGTPTEVLATVDGAMPFKGETVEGYVAGLHADYLADRARRRGLEEPSLVRIEPRFRYNQNFESIAAMAPGIPAILLIMLPAILAAVSVARERELGSITNFYVTPTTRVEFLAGKQLPYLALAFANFILLVIMTIWLFDVPLKGDPLPLALGALLYVWATTAFGLVLSTVTSSQVAAVFATALTSIVPTLQFSGLLQPVSTLDGPAQVIGSLWPASYFLHLNVGAFTKGLGWEGLLPDLVGLALLAPALFLIAVLGLRGQER